VVGPEGGESRDGDGKLPPCDNDLILESARVDALVFGPRLVSEEESQHLVAFPFRQLIDAHRVSGIRVEHLTARERVTLLGTKVALALLNRPKASDV